MQTVAYIFPRFVVYRSGLVFIFAALAGMSLLLALRARQGKPLFDAAAFAALSAVLAAPCARALHWYCNHGMYPSFRAAMTDLTGGGYTATGAVAAVLLSALLLRLFRLVKELPALLDCAAPAGFLTLALGKWACIFSSDCRGKFTLESLSLRHLPWMVSSVLPSGGTEWRIATFALESMADTLICLLFLLLFTPLARQNRHRKAWKDGNVFLLSMTLFGALTLVLDSTRYDALYLRSNGFVSLTQICCMAALLFPAVLYSVRSVRAEGLRPSHFLLWLLWLALAGLGGYMEYYVQRHAAEFLKAYAVMATSFLSDFLIVCILCRKTRES